MFNKLTIMQNNSKISTPTTNQANSSPQQSLEFLKQQQQIEQRKQQLEQPIPTDPFQATGQDELFKTLAGGPALIFEMARNSILFSDTNKPTTTTTTMTTSTKSTTLSFETRQPPPQSQQQHRWYPHSGISDDNPSFRTQSPAMNNQGFAKVIWKNVRKRNKPSLWKHALRTYDRMAMLEGDPDFSQIQRSNIHHEGAMQACAKLGRWQRALEIYHFVYQKEMSEIEGNGNNRQQTQQQQQKSQRISRKNKALESTVGGSGSRSYTRKKNNERIKKGSVYVTDDMVLSLVRATVRASRLRSRRKNSHDPPLSPEQEEREAALRRIPLDTALEILSTLPEDHNIPCFPYFFNPLAAAYQSLGYTQHSKEILESMLSNRTAGEDEILNVHDLCAKDKGSYSLLVQASVVTGDWGSAVESLNEMTNAGIYPNPRHCNIWSEISERHNRPRAVGSWKKKRDDYWTESIH